MFRNARLTSRRLYSSGPIGHAQVYTSIIPAMIPVFLLGSAVYLGLELTQVKLSHEQYMMEATKRIDLLEAEIATLQAQIGSVSQSNTASTTSPSRWWWKG